MHNLIKVCVSHFSAAKTYWGLRPPVIIPMNVDSTATGKKIDKETKILTIFTLNAKNNTARYDEVCISLYQKNKETKNLLIVASKQKQYINLDNN